MPRAALPPGKLPHALLSSLLKELPSADGVVVGPGVGRDVAVIEGSDGGDRLWLATSDPITFATDRIGRYAVTVNVNDIAAAGGMPRFFLATLLLPEDATTEATVRAIFEEISAACREFGIGWIGGHSEVTLGLDRVVVAGTLLGEVTRADLVRSDGGRTGDVVICAGQVPLEGGALLGSGCAEALTAAGLGADALAELSGLLDVPGLCVLPAARALCDAVRPHAMHDPTEGGIATALWELAEAGGTGVRVEVDSIPWHPLAVRAARTLGLDPLGLIASGALLAAVAPEDEAPALAALASAGAPAATIATLVPEAAGRVLVEAGRERPLPVFASDEITRAFSG